MASKHILMIDDEMDIREIARISLEKLRGWQVTGTASGYEGVELAQQHQPDVILLDVMMPEIDGKETLKLLKANPKTKHIPVIWLTAQVQMTRREAAASGGVGVLIKPFDPLELPNQIEAALDFQTEE
ncbi:MULTISPECIES: response regulator [unclassified Roseofilum]|uniref:response regulator n=1 Tax=unclassified Roseofilum TaxID=2620099 RepID=UPI001B250D3F|nr:MULTISPECIES: response regulator [unclassified Roseofilum]MBP0008997.1 response regulator [Roseofilum sp. Belize Diploria]MBP0035936.1 response regulator [Roseofilum sp. Belize BBD 4]